MESRLFQPYRIGIILSGAVLGGLLLVPVGQSAYADESSVDLNQFRKTVQPFLEQHCLRCHGPKKQEASLALDTLDRNLVKGKDAAKWQLVLDKIRLGEMPPEGSKRPDAAAVKQTTDWLSGALAQVAKVAPDKLGTGRLHGLPYHGNMVDHDALFHGKALGVIDAPPRIWRLSPFIYSQMVTELRRFREEAGQPFSGLPGDNFKDYAASGIIDESTAQQLLRNAHSLVIGMTRHKVENGKAVPEFGGLKEFMPLFQPEQPPSRATIEEAVRDMFRLVLRRLPSDRELERFAHFMEKNIKEAGRVEGARDSLTAVLLLPEVVFRFELGQGKPDARGLVRLKPREIATAIAFALTDKRPDQALLDAAEKGQLETREQVVGQFRRLLNDPKLPRPRVLRFFHEYFGYSRAREVFKENVKDFGYESGVLIADTDALILYILEQDQNVLVELLTTNKSFVNARLTPAKPGQIDPYHSKNNRKTHLNYGLPADWQWTAEQPVELPAGERAGILTQPSWLVAHSQNADNDVVKRGKWLREKLLGGTVPDVPITVNAQVPLDPKKTLRERMQVTRQEYCWQCHQKMDRLGLAFESYDHLGRFRTTELNQPVNARGSIDQSGDGKLDGAADGAVALVKKLAGSDRVRQVFLRHVFRYWMGRNETLGDARTLREMDEAYGKSGGSFKALLLALLTSDSFLCRAVPPQPTP